MAHEATTHDHGLPLPADGQTPWGDDYRAAMQILDAAVPFVRATATRFGNGNVTAIATSQTYVTAALTEVVGNSPCECITVDGDGTINYQGASPRTLSVTAAVTIDPVGNNKIVRASLFKSDNGAPFALVPEAQGRFRVGSAGDFASGVLIGLVDVDAGDRLELRVGNWTDTNDVTVVDLSVLLRG